MSSIDSNHNNFDEVLSLIQEAKRDVYKQANRAIMQHYWELGRYIYHKTTKENWGQGVVKELAQFIQSKDPTLKGYSQRNLWRMKQFYETYSDNPKLSTLWTQLSWSNNRTIFSRCKSKEEQEFYLNLAIKESWGNRELERQISSSLFERVLLADNNLSDIMKSLPQQTQNTFRDSYVFEFLDIPSRHNEKTLQQALVSSLKDFILELGRGFTFMGQEYRLQVGVEDFFIDLLFYHRDLQCLIAFELKVDKFRPSHLGQLEFYLEALDRDVKKEHENPSIGVLLCTDKTDEVVKYALSRSLSPTVIADYETKLIPKEILKQKVDELCRLYENEE
jgi:predicted nuclease of restriction endonuclease-like (RecB) superfamily